MAGAGGMYPTYNDDFARMKNDPFGTLYQTPYERAINPQQTPQEDFTIMPQQQAQPQNNTPLTTDFINNDYKTIYQKYKNPLDELLERYSSY